MGQEEIFCSVRVDMSKMDSYSEWKKSRLEFIKRNGGVNRAALPIKSRGAYDKWVEEGLLSRRIDGDEVVYEYVETHEGQSSQES